MIYIDYNEKTQEVYVPRNGWTPETGDEVSLRAFSTSERVGVSFFVHEWTVKGTFLCLVVGLPEDLFPGEWEYYLSIEDQLRGVGVMQVTEDAEAATQYNKEITYKQYGE